MTSRIILFADSRWRDSFGLALLKHELLKFGHDVYIVPFDLWQQAIELIRPSVVILNHVFGRRNKKIAEVVRRRKGKVVVLPTEGRPNTQYAEEWFAKQDGKFDLLLSWNQIVADYFKKTPSLITGCPRFDVYQKPYNQLIYSREKAAEKHGLDPARKTILVASSFPQAKFHLRNSQFNRHDWKDLQIGIDPDEYAKNDYLALQKFQLAIAQLKTENPEYQIAVKPHPMESRIEWARFCDQYSITLITQEYIFNFLAMGDILINRVGCNTTMDAWLMSKPVLQCNFDRKDIDSAEEEAWKIGPSTASVPSLVSNISKVLTYGSVLPQGVVDNYLEKYGFSIQESAKKCGIAIDEISPISTDVPFSSLLEWNTLVSDFDQQRLYPNLNDLVMGKTVTQNAINNWMRDIKAIENGRLSR